jgi:predicted alpha/beta-fold hydrolase
MGVWQDIKEPIDYIHATHNRPIYLFACSLGAICSTLYLINDAENTPVRAATFYGTPLSSIRNGDYFDNSLYGFYSWVMGRSLIAKITPLFTEVKKRSTPEQIKCYDKLLTGEVSPNLNNVDDYFTSPMFGYKDRRDYRTQVSVHDQLHKLKIPCFYLHSWDDFIVGPDCVPHDEFERCENIILATTTRGSHCCHFEMGQLGGLLPT